MLKLGTAVVAFALLASGAAYAHGWHGSGASRYAPGHMMRSSGRYGSYPGASGYAPGRRMLLHMSAPYSGPGASGFAPGAYMRRW